MPFDSESGREAGRKSKRKSVAREKFEDALEGVSDKIDANTLWELLEKIKDPAQKFDRMMNLIHSKVPKPKSQEINFNPGEEGYTITFTQPVDYTTSA